MTISIKTIPRNDPASLQGPVRKGVSRLIAGYATIAFILPYLTLKIAWISGVPVGMPNKSLATAPSMLALNILTFCMDTVAILLALTFTHRWGLRVPVWLQLFPMWVGTGFLAPIAVAAPIIALVGMLGPDSGQRLSSEQALVEPWVYKVVYTSFVGQGLTLIIAFILYVRARWDGLLRLSIVDCPPPRPAIRLLGNAAAVVAAAVGLLQLFWAAGAPLGLPPQLLFRRGASFYLLNAAFGLAALGAATGIAILLNRLGQRPLWLWLSLAWIGAGAMFSWGAWGTLNVVLGTVLVRVRGEGAWILLALDVIKTGAGLLIGALLGLLIAAVARRLRATVIAPPIQSYSGNN